VAGSEQSPIGLLGILASAKHDWQSFLARTRRKVAANGDFVFVGGKKLFTKSNTPEIRHKPGMAAFVPDRRTGSGALRQQVSDPDEQDDIGSNRSREQKKAED
jgi:hypothetical protein